MIELIKFELKKIFSNKLIYITAIGIAIFGLSYPISRYSQIKAAFNEKTEIEALAEKYISDEYTADEIKSIRDSAINKANNKENLNKEEEFLLYYSGSYIKVNKDIQSERLKVIESRLDELESNSNEDTSDYKSLLKEKETLTNLGKQESMYLGDWKIVFDFNVAATMKLILLVLGLAGVFSSEYTSRVSYLNLSTKRGKTKLNTAKIISALIYGTIVFIFVSSIYHISGFALGLPNGDKSASYIFSSLYNMTINEFYIGTLVFSYLGTISFSVLIVLLSLITKNILVSFGLPLAIYFLPDMLMFQGPIMKCIYHINFTQLMKGKNILGGFITFDFLGNIVQYPYVITIVSIITVIIMLIIYRKFSKKQSIA